MEKFSLEKKEMDKHSMNNQYILDIVFEVENAKTCMENVLIWRKVNIRKEKAMVWIEQNWKKRMIWRI